MPHIAITTHFTLTHPSLPRTTRKRSIDSLGFIDIAEIVKRRCVCTAATCMSQFRDDIEVVLCVRRAYRALDVNSQLHQLQIIASVDSGESVLVPHVGLDNVLNASPVGSDGGDVLLPSPTGTLPASEASDEAHSAMLPASPHPCDPGDADHLDNLGDVGVPAPPKRRYRPRTASTKMRSRTFAGKPVCEKGLCALLGISCKTLQLARDGGRQDLRRLRKPKHPLGFAMLMRKNMKWQEVLSFFWLVYQSEAEGLPNRLTVIAESADAHMDSDVDISTDDDDEVGVQRRATAVALQLTSGQSLEDVLGSGPGNWTMGPRRYLAHGTPLELYWQYRATHGDVGTDPASFSTFLRVYHRCFRTWLGWRKKKEFAECTTCQGLKHEMRNAQSVPERQSPGT
jgi:hypothetical protein